MKLLRQRSVFGVKSDDPWWIVPIALSGHAYMDITLK
jgi:hypothetical protein